MNHNITTALSHEQRDVLEALAQRSSPSECEVLRTILDETRPPDESKAPGPMPVDQLIRHLRNHVGGTNWSIGVCAQAADILADARVTSAPPPASDFPAFPTMLRKMWSGGDVQRWIDDNIKPLMQERHHDFHCAPNTPPAPSHTGHNNELQAAQMMVRDAIIDKVLEAINAIIRKGPLIEPFHSERNGMIHAYNCVSMLCSSLANEGG